MIKEYMPQLLIALFVTIFGGVVVYHLTEANDSVATTDFGLMKNNVETRGFSNLGLSINGSSNQVYVRRGKTKLQINDITVSGSSKKLSYSIPPNYIVNINMAGSANLIYISSELRDFIFVNDLGSSNSVFYSDD